MHRLAVPWVFILEESGEDRSPSGVRVMVRRSEEAHPGIPKNRGVFGEGSEASGAGHRVFPMQSRSDRFLNVGYFAEADAFFFLLRCCFFIRLTSRIMRNASLTGLTFDSDCR